MKNSETIALHKLYADLKDGAVYGEDLTNVRFPVFWQVLSCNGRYIHYRHYGSSATSVSLRDLKWIINVIFNMSVTEFLGKYIERSESACEKPANA